MKWNTHSVYVDIDTGEQLDEYVALCSYIKIKTNKNATFNSTTDKGTVTYTHECRRSNQLSLFGNTANEGTI